MAEILYPKRQRCKTCSKKLDKVVLAGMFCSYRCGSFPNPAKTLAEAPRGCKREVNNVWDYKTRFLAPTLVPDKFKNDAAVNVYLCDNCRQYHIGHSRPETFETLSRYINSPKELGEVIRKHREALKVDKKVLAKALKIPVIRITELEEGNKTVQLGTLLAVLDALRVKLSLVDSRKK